MSDLSRIPHARVTIYPVIYQVTITTIFRPRDFIGDVNITYAKLTALEGTHSELFNLALAITYSFSARLRTTQCLCGAVILMSAKDQACADSATAFFATGIFVLSISSLLSIRVLNGR